MATRYFINGGTNSNWSNSKNWSLASGGTGNAGVPTASINVIFDNNSPNCIIDSLTSSNCLALTFTSYSNIITFNNNLGVYGNLILGSGMSFSGTSSMIIAGSASITSNGKPIGVPLIFDPLVSSLGFVLNIDTVLNDDLILDNDLNIGVQISPSLAQLAINGNSVYINSNLYMNSGNGILDGVITNSANLIFSG